MGIVPNIILYKAGINRQEGDVMKKMLNLLVLATAAVFSFGALAMDQGTVQFSNRSGQTCIFMQKSKGCFVEHALASGSRSKTYSLAEVEGAWLIGPNGALRLFKGWGSSMNLSALKTEGYEVVRVSNSSSPLDIVVLFDRDGSIKFQE